MCLDTNDTLYTLISQLDTFINGAAGSKVHTTQGAIDTLSGLVQNIKTLPLVQPVIDIATTTDAISLAGTAMLPVGALVRITADTDPARNGLYTVKDVNVIERKDYLEVCNLVQPPQLQKTFGSNEALTNPVVIFSKPITQTSNQTIFITLEIKQTLLVQKPGIENVEFNTYYVTLRIPPDDTVLTSISPLVPAATPELADYKARVVTSQTLGRVVELYLEPLTELVPLAPFVLRSTALVELNEMV